MPCRCYEEELFSRQGEMQRVCKHLIYVMDALIGEEVPSWAIKASTRNYPDTSRLDEATAMLCALCRDMSPRDQNTIIYDGRSSKARAPADWWDHHQEEDAREAERKAAAARKEQLKQQALNKLTPEERAALLG